jgi:hypothetical protein
MSVQTFLTATTSKLTSKSSSLDTTLILEHKIEIKLKAAEEKLKATVKR